MSEYSYIGEDITLDLSPISLFRRSETHLTGDLSLGLTTESPHYRPLITREGDLSLTFSLDSEVVFGKGYTEKSDLTLDINPVSKYILWKEGLYNFNNITSEEFVDNPMVLWDFFQGDLSRWYVQDEGPDSVIEIQNEELRCYLGSDDSNNKASLWRPLFWPDTDFIISADGMSMNTNQTNMLKLYSPSAEIGYIRYRYDGNLFFAYVVTDYYASWPEDYRIWDKENAIWKPASEGVPTSSYLNPGEWGHFEIEKNGNTLYFRHFDMDGNLLEEASVDPGTRPYWYGLNIGKGWCDSSWVGESRHDNVVVKEKKGIKDYLIGVAPNGIFVAQTNDSGEIRSLNTKFLDSFSGEAYSACIEGDYIYVTHKNGEVAKINIRDLSDITTLNIDTAHQILDIDEIPEKKKFYLSTDSDDARSILLEDATIENLNTDIRFNQQISDSVATSIDYLAGNIVGTNLSVRQKIAKVATTDMRWLIHSYEEISSQPSPRTDFSVEINGSEPDDIDLSSINININYDDLSTVNFDLAREHDSQFPSIGSEVIIYFGGEKLFKGKIRKIRCIGDTERITIHCESYTFPIAKKSYKSLALSSADERTHLFDVLLSEIEIDNPKVNERELQIGGNVTLDGQPCSTNVRFDLYDDEDNFVASQNQTGETYNLIFSNLEPGVEYEARLIQPDKNVIFNIWPGERKLCDIDINKDDINLTIDESDLLEGRYKGIKYYKEAVIGHSVYHGDTFSAGFSVGSLEEQIKEGTWKPEEGYTYFWWFEGYNYRTDDEIYMSYVGTSLSGVSDDIWSISTVDNKAQKINKYVYVKPPYWEYIGYAPFKEISVQSGAERWAGSIYEDKDAYLYLIWPAEYDYDIFADVVAQAEYDRLKNTSSENDSEQGIIFEKDESVYPKTNATIDITLDALLFYNIDILNKINLSNTTESNIFKNNNGFPVMVKSITINSVNMKATLECDNAKVDTTNPPGIKSAYEEQDIREKYAHLKYEKEQKELKLNHKFDLTSMEFIDEPEEPPAFLQ